MSLPSRRNRTARTPRQLSTPRISFTSHDWNAPSSRRRPQSARKRNTTTTTTTAPTTTKQPSSSTNHSSGGSGALTFGMDNLIELNRLTSLTKDRALPSKTYTPPSQLTETTHSKDDAAVVNDAVLKLRQVFENKHSLRESYVQDQACLPLQVLFACTCLTQFSFFHYLLAF